MRIAVHYKPTRMLQVEVDIAEPLLVRLCVERAAHYPDSGLMLGLYQASGMLGFA